MDSHDQIDGVYAGRYVLVEYDTALDGTDYDKGWYLVSKDGQHIPYGSINTCRDTEDTFYLTFNGPIASSHFVAEDVTMPILYFAPHKHFTILNSDIFYIKAKKDGTYVEITQEEYEQEYTETNLVIHAHIANNLAYFDNEEIFPDDETYVYAQVLPGQKYSYNERGEFWSVSKTETFIVRIDQSTIYTYKYMTQLSDTSNSYLYNFNIDNSYYNTSRGYDSTVWQKVYSNGKEKYVMIAELNTVVPTFGVTSDAPSLLPISPHFGADSTNVYYDLHWQPSWGFRIKAASNAWNVSQIKANGQLVLRNENNIQSQINNIKTRQKDTTFYPSDQFVTWSQTFEDNTLAGDAKRRTLYYDSQSQTWVQDQSFQLPAAIYFNKDGFSSSEISYSDDLISEESRTSNWGKYNQAVAGSNWENDDAITITPTGLSGNGYNAHDGSIDNKFQEDIQELSIMLPSVGDTIARVWDLVYGGRDTTEGIKETNLRNKDIAWEDAKVEPSRRGLRLAGQGGDEYNTAQVDTLAGAINTAHDLIGMIISANTDEELEDLENLDKNRIYYNTDLKQYFRKHETYDFTELDEEEFEYPSISSSGLSQAEIDKGLYYIKVNNEYVLATRYIDGVQYYIKTIKTPYEEIEYELNDFPYTDEQNRSYLWYQDYLGENTRYVEDLTPSLKALRSDYVYDPEYHSDRSYYYINPRAISLTASYAPKKYWYKLTNNNVSLFRLDASENQTRDRVYYKFNPNSLVRCPSGTMVYVPGLYYFKRRTGAGEDDYSYELDISENRSQNYLNGNSEVYRDQSGSIVYYQLNIVVIKNASGEEIVYKVVQVPEPVEVDETNFLADIFYYQDTNGKYVKASEYIPNKRWFYMKTTYEKTDGSQVDVQVLRQWFANDLLLHRTETFYTVTKDTNGNVTQLTELTRQELLDRRDEIFNQEIYTLGLSGDSSRPYITMTEAENNGIITRQDEFYQSNTYHYERNNSYILDTNPQYTENRQYYIIDEAPIRLNSNLHFYEKNKYYQEMPNDEGFELVTSSLMPTNTTFYKKNEYFVIEDTKELLRYGSKWNLEILAIPSSITLGKKETRYELIQLPNYSVNTNTLNGMLLKIHQMLELNDTLTRSDDNLNGLMNQLKDLLAGFKITKAREIVIVDDYGRYHNAPLNGDHWLEVEIDGDPEEPSININHFVDNIDTTVANNLDFNESGDRFTVTDISNDLAGHITANKNHTYILPYNWKTISTLGANSVVTDLTVPEVNNSYSSNVSANSCRDTLQIDPGNKWIKMLAEDANNKFTIAHIVSNLTTTDKTETPLDGVGEFTVQDIEWDEAGHLTAIQNHKYTLPYTWRNIAIDANHKIEADCYNDTVHLDKDDWVGIEFIDQTTGENPVTDTIKFTHSVAQAASSSVINANQTPSFNSTFDIPSIGIDAKGHVASLGTKTITLPDLSVTAGTGDVVTSITYAVGSGVFTENKTNVGTLTITDFSALTSDYSQTLVLATTDSINKAFAKLERRIANEETNRINAIESLDVNNISGFGKDKTLVTLTETDGKIAATFQDIYITSAAVKVGQTATQGNEESQDITLANWIADLDYTGTGLTAGKTLSAFTQEDGKVSLSTQDIAITAAQVTVDNNTNFDHRYYTETEVNNLIEVLDQTNSINSGEVHLLKSLSEADGVISYTSEKLAWDHITALSSSEGYTFVNSNQLASHTHPLSITVDNTGTSTITLSSGNIYKITAGGTDFVFEMDNFAADTHTHNASEIDSGILNIARLPDLSSNYALASHTHSTTDITNLGTIDIYDATNNPKGIIGQIITPAISDNLETPDIDESEPAITTQSLIDYIKWLEDRITALENNS